MLVRKPVNLCTSRGFLQGPKGPRAMRFVSLARSQPSCTKEAESLPAVLIERHATQSDEQIATMAPKAPALWRKFVPVSLAFVLCAALLAVSMLSPDAAFAGLGGGPAPSLDGQSGLQYLISFVLHMDKHMADLIVQQGNLVYSILWGIVFCETGLIVAPFLPGDSLLFAAGTFAALGSLNFPLLIAIFLSSAILGDAVNYAVGSRLGKTIADRGIVRKEHLIKTEKFYAKYGGKAIVMARFLPILRTFAPFVAGVGNMSYSKFLLYNVVGAVIWVLGFVSAGYFFGSLPFVQKNFTLVVLAIIVLSCAPVIYEIARGGLTVDDDDEPPAAVKAQEVGSASAKFNGPAANA